MRIFKRGKKYYWFEFRLNGERIQRPTKLSNKTEALTFAAAYRTSLVNGEVGIKNKAKAPTLKAFEKQFIAWVYQNKKKESTREFYERCFARLVEYGPMGNARLNHIDEPLIEKFKSKMLADKFSESTINRYLATLRKALRYASRTLRLLDRVPVITLYGHERQREYVFSSADYQNWIAAAPEPLRSASILARKLAICRGEMLALQRDCVTLHDADEGGLYGSVEIKRGLKRSERRRTLPIYGADVHEVLATLLAESKCEHIFTALDDHSKPLPDHIISVQLVRTRKALNFHPDACLHSLRHSCLTELGRTVDAFTLKKIAGHASVQTTQRYVHPQQDAIAAAFSGREKVPTKSPTESKQKEVYQ